MSDDQLREIPYSNTILFDGHIIRVEKWMVTCPNGEKAAREIVCHKGAAAVIPVFPDGTTLLVRQHRVAIDRITLEIPAGKLDSLDEDPSECAVRELHEETGLIADRMIHLSTIFTTPGFCNEKISIYLALGLTEGTACPDQDEFLSIVRLPLTEAVSMVTSGTIRDGKTVCALLLAHQKLAEMGILS